MNLLQALPSLLNRITGSNAPAVTITFTPQLPAEVRNQITAQNANNPFTLTVTGGNGSRLTFTSATGQTFQATVNPPLPVGTQLQLAATDVMPNQPHMAPGLQAKIMHVPVSSTGTQPVVASATPIPVQGTPQGQTALAPPPTPVLTFPAEATTPQAFKAAITTALLQQAAALPAQPASPSAPQPLPVPAGPVAITVAVPIPPTLFNQPLTLIPTGPLQATGTQAATLTLQSPALPQPQHAPQPAAQPAARSVSITLNLGVELKPNQPQPAVLFPPAPAAPATPQSLAQPVLILTGASTAVPMYPSTPVTVPQAQAVAQPPLQLQHATPQAAQQPALAPVAAPVAARILPPQPGQAAGTQTALLASGTTITLHSQQPLPTGSLVIVTDIPINPTTAVQRVLASEGHPQQQTNTAQQGNQPPGVAAPTATQTRQAVLAPGMVIQGTISGQNEQGQPLLTLTSPANLAGQQAALNLTNPTALLPVGAGLTVRIDTALAATILGLSLPAQTQAAYTVGTIGARWEGLQQGLHALQQQSPLQAANLRASLPQLANLLPGLLAFTNALRTGTPEKALDREATRILKAMGIDLSSDISQLSQLQQRPSPHAENQWRGTLFPYVEAPGEDPRQGGFFWRREKQDNPRAATSTRFVVEVDMSQIGPLQLDGLVTYPDVWLKLRRTTALEEGFTENLQALVTQLLQSYGLGGGISVETTPTFPVNPRAELLAQTENPLPTTA